MFTTSRKNLTFAAKEELLRTIYSRVTDYGSGINNINFKEKSFNLLANSMEKFPKKRISESLLVLQRFFKKYPKRSITAFLIILAIVFVLFKAPKSTPQDLVSGVSNSQTNFSPQKQINIDKKMDLAIRNENGTETEDNLTVTITTIDSSKKILIKGQPATARDTKSFLIINLEIENPTTNQLTVRPVNFIRFQDNQGRSFAPDVHNEDVEVEPVSIKKTRVGFVVDQNQKNFKLLFGELNGDKETIEVVL